MFQRQSPFNFDWQWDQIIRLIISSDCWRFINIIFCMDTLFPWPLDSMATPACRVYSCQISKEWQTHVYVAKPIYPHSNSQQRWEWTEYIYHKSTLKAKLIQLGTNETSTPFRSKCMLVVALWMWSQVQYIRAFLVEALGLFLRFPLKRQPFHSDQRLCKQTDTRTRM